jgi:hypothetical protein
MNMRALATALTHISDGTAYSWDLTTLISFGVPVSCQLREKLLSGATTKDDADQLRALMRKLKRGRAS